jgi:non-ribosomal peptide synthase protein (TIGR01720 family)
MLQTRVHNVYNTEINDILLTGLGLALEEVLGIDNSVVKMEGHGREDIISDVDISRTVGWFTSVYPFVLDVSGSSSISDRLVSVKESLRKIPNKGVGYGMLKYLSEGMSGDLSTSIIFNYLGDFGSNGGNSEASMFEYSSEFIGHTSATTGGSDTVLDVSGMMVSEELTMSIKYSKECYNAETIELLSASYERHLTQLIEELAAIQTNTNSFKNHSDENQLELLNIDKPETFLNRTWQVGDKTELSFNQIYHISKQTFGFISTNISDYCEDTFEQEIRKFLYKFPVLTVNFTTINGEVFQEYISSDEVKLDSKTTHISGLSKINEIEEEIKNYFMSPLDKFKDPLLRLYIVTSSDDNDESLLFLGIPHVLTDAYSNIILKKELVTFFNNSNVEKEYVSNFDFVDWQRDFLTSKIAMSSRLFWIELFKQKIISEKESKRDMFASRFIKQTAVISGSDFELLSGKATSLNLPISALLLVAHQNLLMKRYHITKIFLEAEVIMVKQKLVPPILQQVL